MLAALWPGHRRQAAPAVHAQQGFRLYRRALIEENKWRAARWGLDGKLIDFGKRAEVPMRDLALELLEFVDDVVDELGSRAAVELRAHDPRAKAPAPIGSSPSTARPATSRRWCATWCRRHATRVAVRRSSDERTSEDTGRTAVRPRIQLSAGVHRARQPARASRTASPPRW